MLARPLPPPVPSAHVWDTLGGTVPPLCSLSGGTVPPLCSLTSIVVHRARAASPSHTASRSQGKINDDNDGCEDVTPATCAAIGGNFSSATCGQYAAWVAPANGPVNCTASGSVVRGLAAICCGGNAGATPCGAALPTCAGTVPNSVELEVGLKQLSDSLRRVRSAGVCPGQAN